jgi:hypothetical protein
MRLWIHQGQIQGIGEKHQSNRDAVCAGQSAQSEKEAVGDQRAATAEKTQSSGASENGMKGAKTEQEELEKRRKKCNLTNAQCVLLKNQDSKTAQ